MVPFDKGSHLRLQVESIDPRMLMAELQYKLVPVRKWHRDKAPPVVLC